MAPRKKAKPVDTGNIELNDSDLELLAYIQSKTDTENFVYTASASTQAYADMGLIEFNSSLRNNNGDYATRITQKGRDIIMAKKAVVNETISAPAAKASSFAIGTFNPAFAAPKAKSARRGREAKYNFDALEVNQFIFVPCTEKHSDANDLAKSLTGSIQAANRKYAVETSDTKIMKRKNKDTGEIIEKTLPVLSYTRKFATYPYNMDGAVGVAMVRVQ